MKTKYDLKILLSSKTFVKLSKLSFICVFSAFEKSRVAYNNLSGEHDIDAARDAHVGEYDSEEDFAYELLEECDYYGMPENMRHYFNVSRFAEDLSDDVAHKLCGGKWRIPTKEQFEELIDHTKHRWTKINGVKGMLFTGRNGHSIFLPAAGRRFGTSLGNAGSNGYCWSRTLDADNPYDAFSLYFASGGMGVYYSYRYNGHTVRPFRP